jgi:hypothetical protein
LVGHYASERFALSWLSDCLAQKLPDARVWASQSEQDPLYVI